MIEFTVRADPRPKGSKRAFINPKTGRAFLVDESDKSLRSWETAIRFRAQDAMEASGLAGMLTGVVQLEVEFRLRRPAWAIPGPKSKKIAPVFPETKPDVDKLVRAVMDALRNVAYKDDAQVAKLTVEKRYVAGDEAPGVRITIDSLDQFVTHQPLNEPAFF